MKASQIRNYLLISLGTTFLLVILGFMIFNSSYRQGPSGSTSDNNGGRSDPHLPIFFAKLVEDSAGEARSKILNDFKDPKSPSIVWFLDRQGNVLFSTENRPLPFDFSKAQVPKEDLEQTEIFDSGMRPVSIVKLNDFSFSYMVTKSRIPDMRSEQKPPGLLTFLFLLLVTFLLASGVSLTVLFFYVKKASTKDKGTGGI